MNEDTIKKLEQLPAYGHFIDWDKMKKNVSYMLVGSYANSDTEHAFDSVIGTYAQEIVQGLYELGDFFNIEDMRLIVDNQDLMKQLAFYANQKNIIVEQSDFIHVRDYKGFFLDFVTLINIARTSAGKEPVFFLKVDEGKLFEIEAGKKLKEYVAAENLKAVVINHEFFTPDILERQLDNTWNLGSGVIHTIREKECIIQKVIEETAVLRNQSCGICTYCREGLYQISTTVNGMTKPGTKTETLNLMQEIGEAMQISYMCTVGQCAAKPFLSARALFKEEMEAHCGRGKCPSGVCKGFMSIYIDPHKCEGCGECIDVCPKNCIDGKPKFISMIDDFECDKCGRCLDVCENEAVVCTSNRVPKLPTRLTKVGRFK